MLIQGDTAMNTPNLFDFATSELSQDAFIAWLLSWAKQEYKTGSDKHKALNKIAIDVLAVFFQKAGEQLPSCIEKIDVKRQVNHIDVLCIINETYAVLIEDKVGTVQHSNQLVRYKQYLMTKHQFTEDQLILIYLQTHDQSNYNKVIKHGFYPVLRKDLLQVFDNANNETARQSDIYADYYDYLQSIETAVQSFQKIPIKEWNRRAWIGFYQYLQKQLGEGNWKYVANANGGFMGFWGLGCTVDDIRVYLQLEQNNVCFKMTVQDGSNYKKARKNLHKIFVNEADKLDLIVRKPKKFGSGKTMTFAVLETDIFSETDKPIDLQAVIKLMNQLRIFIKHCSGLYEQQKAES